MAEREDCSQTEIACHYASQEDLDWILSSMHKNWEEMISTAKRNLAAHQWIPSAGELASAIESKTVFIAFINSMRVGYLTFVQHNQSHFGIGYGDWFNPFLYITSVYTVPEHRNRGVFKSLCQEVERVATSRNITEIIMHMFCASSIPLNLPERSAGFKRQVGIFEQTLQEYSESLPRLQQKYSERWAQWSARNANDDEAKYLVDGLADIYHLEGYGDQTDDMSEELSQAETFIREKRAIIAFDRSTNDRLGLLTYAVGENRFPYGCGTFGHFSQRYLWCSYVWIEPKMRSAGVARYLYDQLFERAKAINSDFVGLDVFNRNADSWSFHEKGLLFNPQVQMYNKILEK